LACNCGTSSAPEAKAPADSTPPTPSALADLPKLEPDEREKFLARGMSMLLEQEHLKKQKIGDEVSEKAFAEYVDAIDPGKSFLLANQVAAMRAYSNRMDDQLRDGDLELGRIGAALLKQRQQVVRKMIAELLTKPFEYERDEFLETDNDKLKFVNSNKELRDRWRKVLKLQVMERVARMEEVKEALAKAKAKAKDKAKPKNDNKAPGSDEAADRSLKNIPATAEGREKKARTDIAKTYDGRFSRLAKMEALEPSESFLNALTAVYDPHTVYLAPAEKDNFDIQMSGSLEGIGAVLSEDDHYISVREIVPGGASWRQGRLKAGDLILAVAQKGKEPVDVADMRINQVVQMIRGPKGSVVSLTVKKPDDTVETISITRDVIAIEAAYARGAIIKSPNREPMGYISLPSFYGNTRARPGRTPERDASTDLAQLLNAMSKRSVRGIILDLRGNGGGLLEHARVITGLFIDRGPVVQTVSPSEGSTVLSDDDAGVAFDGDLIVLVDRFSASASEIVAGALKDYSRAVIVGTSATHGKGTVQMLLDLNRLAGQADKPLGVLKLTIQQFFRVNGASTQWKGVAPDIALADPTAHIESGERYLDNAIPFTAVDPLKYQRWARGTWDLAALTRLSTQRQSANDAFMKVNKRTAYLKERAKDTRIPLKRSSWSTRRAKDRKALESIDPKLSESGERLKVRVVNYGRTRDTRAETDRLKAWKRSLSRDPWVEESRNILVDMLSQRRAAAQVGR